MAGTECRDCGAWLAPGDDVCFDCGAATSLRDEADERAFRRVLLGAALGALLAGGLGALSPFLAASLLLLGGAVAIFREPALDDLPFRIAGASALIGLSAGVAVFPDGAGKHVLAGVLAGALGAFLGARTGKARTVEEAEAERSSASLQETERFLRARIEVMRETAASMDALAEDLRERNNAESKRALATLLPARAAHERALGAWWAKLWDIRLLRWENRIEPLADGLFSIGASEAERRLNVARDATREARRMEVEWRSIASDEIPEVSATLRRLAESGKALDALTEQLMLRQAAGLAKGVSPAREAAQRLALPDETRARFGAFRARVEANRICGEVEALAREADRIRAEASSAFIVERG